MRTSKLRNAIVMSGTLFGASLAAACSGGSDPAPTPAPTGQGASATTTQTQDGGDTDGGTTKKAGDQGSGAQTW